MKIEHLLKGEPTVVGVLLSERNLKSLLEALQGDPNAKRSIIRMQQDEVLVVVMGERDDDHYAENFVEPDEAAA